METQAVVIIRDLENLYVDHSARDVADEMAMLVDDLLWESEWDTVIDILDRIDPAKLPPNVITGLLMFTRLDPNELPEEKNIQVAEARTHLLERAAVPWAEVWGWDVDRIKRSTKRLQS